jgi:ribosomal-protein-alanine N-acetyltransferase
MLSINFSPFPELTTDRLILREVTMNDAESVFRLRSNEQVMKYIPRPRAKSIEEAENWLRVIIEAIQINEAINWAICLKVNPSTHIGNIGYWHLQNENYRGEIGYMLDPLFFGKGIMLEAMKPVLQYGFNVMNLHSIEALVDPENIASCNVLLKAGFQQEGYFRENCFYDGKFLDTVVFSLVAPAQNS